MEHSHDADEAMKAFADMRGVDLTIDEATNRRLVRKIDLNLLPVMCIVYGLNYLDKTTISYASIMGFKTDTNLHGNDYSWVSSMFYFGYIAFEYPTNRLLQMLPIGKFSAAAIVAWGTTLCCMAAVNSYGSALAVRFILGVCESAVTPGFARESILDRGPLLQPLKSFSYHLAMVHQSRAGHPCGHLVQLQWLRADSRRLDCVRHCPRRGQTRVIHRGLEDQLPMDWPADDCGWDYLLLCCPR